MSKKTTENQEITKAFGRRLRQLRLEMTGLSQDEFADKAGFHRAFIGTVERGETNITLVNIAKLCLALGVTPQQFFEGFPETLTKVSES